MIKFLRTFAIKSPLHEKIANGFAWSLLAKVIVSGTGIWFNALLTRFLSSKEVGIYFLLLSLASIISMVSSLGLRGATVKLISDALVLEPASVKKVIRQVFLLNLMGMSLMTFLVLGWGKWIFRQLFDLSEISLTNSLLLELLILWGGILSLTTLIAEIFRGFQDIRWASLLGGGGALKRLALVCVLYIIWVIRHTITLEDLLKIIIVINVIVFSMAGVLLIKKYFKKYRDEIAVDQKLLKVKETPLTKKVIDMWRVFQVAWPFWINSLSMLIFTQADIFFLGVFRPNNEVALYGVSVRLAALVSTPLLILNAVLPPFVAELYVKKKKKQLERILQRSATLMMLPAIGMFLIFLLWGKSILYLLYGGAFYQQAYYFLVILAGGQMINVLSGSCGLLMNMSGYQKHFMSISVVMGLISLLLHYWLVPSLGAIATSLIVTFNVTGVVIAAMIFDWKILSIRTWPTFVFIKTE